VSCGDQSLWGGDVYTMNALAIASETEREREREREIHRYINIQA
jgi:hypothetical protein